VQGVSSRTWWARPGLEAEHGRLKIAGRDAEEVARERGTPLYVYDGARVIEQARALDAAFRAAGLDGVIRLALKAQREPAILALLREGAPFVGIDACSPGEVGWALEHGWSAGEISYTGTNLSEKDLDRIFAAGVHVNVDLLSQLRRFGRRAPGARVGIRINPRVGAGAGGAPTNLYAGPKPTKFGIYPEQLPDAVAIAREHGLIVDTVHFHTSDGYLTGGLPVFADAVARAADAVRFLRAEGLPIEEVNTGGGLGVPQVAGDEPLDVGAWAAILTEHMGSLDVRVGTEPGDFLVKECGVHLMEVVTVEEREGVRFVGTDSGWNVMSERFIYRSPFDVICCRDVDGPPGEPVTISGNINEGDDLFAEGAALPEVDEGDILAVISVGSYNASMTSEHCLREPAASTVFGDRL
jgi:diaminopimelate decarboxylase